MAVCICARQGLAELFWHRNICRFRQVVIVEIGRLYFSAFYGPHVRLQQVAVDWATKLRFNANNMIISKLTSTFNSL